MISRRYTLASLAAIVAGGLAAWLMPKPLPEWAPDKLIAEVRAGSVRQVTITDGQVLTGVSATDGPFRVPLKDGGAPLIAVLSESGIAITYEASSLNNF